jgi:hypothetical protein
MKKLFLALAAMGLFAACTTPGSNEPGGNGGNTDNPGNNDDPVVTEGSFAIEVTPTACKAAVVVTPAADFQGYYYDNVVSAAKYIELGGTDNAFLTAYIAERTTVFENNGYTWLDMVMDGTDVDEWTKEGLEPETDYYVVAFGIDKNGNATTGLSKKAFTTEAAKSYSGWFGTYTASTPKSYSFMYDTGLEDIVEEVVNAPKSQTVFVQNAAEYLENPEAEGAAFIWNLSAMFESDASKGLDYYYMMPALGVFNADGDLEVQNLYDVYEWEGQGVYLSWLAYCTAEGVSAATTFVNGEYAAHAFPLAQNGVSTSVPYKGGLQGGGSFEVIVFDIFQRTDDNRVGYYVEDDTPVYCFYGPISLTKTSDDIVIAPAPEEEPAAVRSSISKAKLNLAISKVKASKNIMQAKNRF